MAAIDANNINIENNQFYIYDKDYLDFSLEILVATSISDTVFVKLDRNTDKKFKIIAIIKGFDSPTNFNCDRHFSIELTNVIL